MRLAKGLGVAAGLRCFGWGVARHAVVLWAFALSEDAATTKDAMLKRLGGSVAT